MPVFIGSGSGVTKTTVPGLADLDCPTSVNKTNWLLLYKQYRDEFALSASGTALAVDRTNGGAACCYLVWQ